MYHYLLRVRIPPVAWMCVSYNSYVLLQVQASATGRSFVQKIPTECVTERDTDPLHLELLSRKGLD
jgi:hypothetical protein